MPNKNFSSEGVPARQSGGDYHRAQIIQWTALAVYAILVSVGLANHEMWRDEALHWLIAIRSKSFSEIIHLTSYQGHPPLWHFLLFLLYKLYPSYVGMQILHGAIAVLVAYLILFHTPFPIFQRVLIIFGYFFFYEYAVVARNYNLVTLFSLLLAIIYFQREKKFLFFSFLLLLNIFSHVHGLLFSSALVGCILWEQLQRMKREKKFSFTKAEMVIYIVFFFSLIGFVLAVYPPADYRYYFTRDKIWFSGTSFRNFFDALSGVWDGYFAVPKWSVNFWNENLLNNGDIRKYFPESISNLFLRMGGIIGLHDAGVIIKFLPVIFILVVFGRSFFYYSVAGRFFLLGNFFLLAFLTFVYNNGMFRQNGFFFIVLMTAMFFIYKDKAQKNIPLLIRRLWTIILITQIMGSAVAFCYDRKYAFSSAYEVTDYIKPNRKADDAVVVSFAPIASSLSIYMNEDVYAFPLDSAVSYISWNSEKVLQHPDPDAFLNFSKKLFLKNYKRIWILAYDKLSASMKDFGEHENLLNDYRWRFVKYFGPSVSYEDFYLYELERTK